MRDSDHGAERFEQQQLAPRDQVAPIHQRTRLGTLALTDPIVLVLAEGATPAAVANAKGHLFEVFIAKLLSLHGFESPTFENLNVTADGIELDVEARHRLTNQLALAECKAYTVPVRAELLDTFYGKLAIRRFREPSAHGFFVALPRLTAQGREQEETVREHDRNFSVLTAVEIVHALRERGEISDSPALVPFPSDPAVVITEHGVYAACVELNATSRTPARVLVWAPDRSVPVTVIEALASSEYAQGVRVEDARAAPSGVVSTAPPGEQNAGLIVLVRGSGSDFEYQLPASPRFFVGRKKLVNAFRDVLASAKAVIILNAQSGWGKSSLALRLQQELRERGGYALVVDSRTAASARFVTEVLRRAAIDAQQSGLLKLPADPSWASLTSALGTLRDADWSGASPLMVFFDQFENVFRDESLTREFRDLALGAQELGGKLLVGFAWKTDLVGWTEGHPYRLRDEIRGSAEVLTLDPLGAKEVELLLRRLERELKQSLARELRQRLREYSQGLPWLLKKLAGHLIREVRQGATQEQLIGEALNVQNLFEADLAELGPGEQEALRYVARHAPIAVSEVLERIQAQVAQSLLDRRLLVQVGERLDTYWDIFRDYLNTGRVPVEDSYIIRQTPRMVARLLRQVVKHDGDALVHDIAAELNTSENAVFNMNRELRQLGVAGLEPNRVRLISEVWQAANREAALRQRVAASLRRHRAYSAFIGIAERSGGKVTLAAYARELPNVFPAVEVSPKTWRGYARAFLTWFEYAGLVASKGSFWSLAGDSSEGEGQILGGPPSNRLRGAFPHEPAGPSLRLLERVAALPSRRLHGQLDGPTRSAAGPLFRLGVIASMADGGLAVVRPDLVVDGKVSARALRDLISEIPANRPALALLERNPAATPTEIGEVLRQAWGADWTASTARSAGKYFRSWARAAGVNTQPIPRGSDA